MRPEIKVRDRAKWCGLFGTVESTSSGSFGQSVELRLDRGGVVKTTPGLDPAYQALPTIRHR